MPANVKSDVFTNIFASPPAKNSALAVRAAVFFTRATNLVAVADAAGTIYPVTRLPSHARILGLVVGCSTLGAGAADSDLGLYVAGDWSDPTTSPAAKRADCYCDGVDLTLARNVFAETAAAIGVSSMGNLLGQAIGAPRVPTGIQWGRQVWEDAGDTTAPRPGTEYDLCWTINGDPGSDGSIVTGIYYCFGS